MTGQLPGRNMSIKSTLALTAAIAVAAGLLVAQPAAAAPASNVVESFDGTASSTWNTTLGAATVATKTDAPTAGSGYLRLGYSFAAGNISEVGYSKTPPVVTATVPTSVQVDVKGDGTYNTVYLRLRDATGEIFLYRLDTLNNTSWHTVTLDLRTKPDQSTGGNHNGVLDGPVSLFRLNVARNGTQPASGFADLDNLRFVDEGWTQVQSTAAVFSAKAGASTTLSFQAGTIGDYTLTVADLQGRQRSWTGSASAPGVVRYVWDGRDSGGTALSGSISASISYDTTRNGVVQSPRVLGTPYVTGVSEKAPDDVGSIVGINSFLTTLDDPVTVDAQTRLMETAAVRQAREEFDWNRIEPRQGYFDFAKFDQAVELAAARNVEVVGKLVYSARWASSAPSGTPDADVVFYPPRNNADFAAYAKTVVNRYKDKVHVWEVWNEPNTSAHWKPQADGTAYGRLLASAHTAIKQADPTSVVLGGSLAGFDDGYMSQVHAAGAANAYDGLSIHTYTDGTPENGTSSVYIEGAKSFLARNGMSDRKIWLTELGWSTCTGTCPTGVSEADQAKYLERAYADASARGVAGAFWFSLMEVGNSGSQLDNFGLVETGGRQKPAFAALARVGQALDGAVGVGSMSPTADGLNYIVNGLDTTAGFGVNMIGGGSATIKSSPSVHSGTGSMQVDYGFTGGSQGLEIVANKVISGRPTAVSVWAYGDASNAPIYMKLKDAKGEFFQAKVGQMSAPGWQRQTFYLDGNNPNYERWGGDGVVDYPLTVSSLYVFRPTTGVQFGRVYFDDLSAHMGTVTRGAVAIGRGKNLQLVYSMSSRLTDVPVQSPTAGLRVGSQVTPLDVAKGSTNNLVRVQLNPDRLTTIESSAVTSPDPAYAGELVGVVWRGGDRATYTIQILDSRGVAVRTIASALNFDAGRRTATWNGRTSTGAVASPGNYVIRLVALGADGRKSVLDTPFTLRSR
jgi:hypothetical protein